MARNPDTCTHSTTTQRWVETDYFGEDCEGHFEYETVYTTQDIDTGRYRCTQCGKVMYYTGRWREYYEQSERTQPTKEYP